LEAARPAADTAVCAKHQVVDRAFRPDIEGLRAIAVLLVLFDHAKVPLLRGGYVGVDVFFVLSGFLITGLLVREIEQTGSISLLQFYARRARRLLPAGTLVLVATVIASYRYLGTSRADHVAVDARWAAMFASNIRFINTGTDYLGSQLPPSPLQHFWSLAVEEQFYAIWPALILILSLGPKRVPIRARLCVALVAIIGASLVWSVHQTRVDGTTAYFSPLTRASELGAGAMLAVAVPWLTNIPRRLAPALSWIGLAGIILSALTYSSQTAFPGLAILLPVVGTVLVVLTGTIAPGAGAEFALKRRPLQWLGKLSYSLYLWHWPVLVIAAGRAGRDLTVAENLVLCVIALGLSAVTFALIEDPIRSAVPLKRRHPAVSVAIGAALVALAFGFAGWKLGGGADQSGTVMASSLTPNYATARDVANAVAQGANVKDWPDQPKRIANPAYSKECDVTRKDTTSSVCVHGDPNGSRSLVVYGDSHAAMWVPALDVIGKEAGWKVIQLTKPACQAPDFPRYSGTLKREYTECASYREFALGQIAIIKPDLVLISSAFKDTELWRDGKPTTDGVEDAWANGLKSIIRQITPNSGRIIVIGDMAYPAEPGIDCLTEHDGHVPPCNTERVDAVYAEHNAREREVAEASGAQYIDTIPWFCTESVCPAVIAGLTTHRDAYHVAENYVVWLAGVLGESIGVLPHRIFPPHA
jgi:peptidoglycan/LPS O-acetylase OafA/YrhL